MLWDLHKPRPRQWRSGRPEDSRIARQGVGRPTSLCLLACLPSMDMRGTRSGWSTTRDPRDQMQEDFRLHRGVRAMCARVRRGEVSLDEAGFLCMLLLLCYSV